MFIYHNRHRINKRLVVTKQLNLYCFYFVRLFFCNGCSISSATIVQYILLSLQIPSEVYVHSYINLVDFQWTIATWLLYYISLIDFKYMIATWLLYYVTHWLQVYYSIMDVILPHILLMDYSNMTVILCCTIDCKCTIVSWMLCYLIPYTPHGL